MALLRPDFVLSARVLETIFTRVVGGAESRGAADRADRLLDSIVPAEPLPPLGLFAAAAAAPVDLDLAWPYPEDLDAPYPDDLTAP